MRPNTSTRTEPRHPAVAGLFYQGEADPLRNEIESCYRRGPGSLPPGPAKDDIIAVICPHAGYMYSGMVACHSYHAISGNTYPYVVMVGPDHRSAGPGLSLSGHDHWETPLMSSPVVHSDALDGCGAIRDEATHRPEHSLEVQLPIIQYTFGAIPILPVLMSDQSRDAAVRLGRSLTGLPSEGGRPAVVASSDLTHYEPDGVARDKDAALMHAILKMDMESFYEVLHRRRVSACGYGAIAAIMEYAREMGASGGRLHRYATSGDAGGDYSAVVGYCSISFS